MIRERVIHAATREPSGFGRLDLSSVEGTSSPIGEAGVVLRELGFACGRAALLASRGETAAIARRHAAVFVGDRRDLVAAPDLVRVLGRADGRRRLLVHTVPLPRVANGRGPSWWSARQRTVGRSVSGLIASREIRQALDVLSGVDIEAACRGLPIDVGLTLLRVEAYCGLGRYEEASTTLRAARDAPNHDVWWTRIALARGDFTMLREERRAMNLLHAMPRLLQIVHDTEDESALLRRATAWLTDAAGASGAAILARDDLRVVAGQGIETADIAEAQAAEVFRTGASRTVVAGQPIACVPVRYAAATIGVVIARGDIARGETLVEAATVVASLVGMALRARLDAMALAGRGEALARDILGESLAISELRESIARAAGSSFPVLIEGESGTGKELVASAVHRLSARRDRRLCAVNCAALTDELIEAEMFGHTRGAFTGAVGARPGLFEEAHRSSLFLDEVAELSPRGQAKLLRVLQEREIRRLGENAPRAVDVRVIGATNVPLADAVAQGRFREDLRFRLAVIRLRVPPLRERIEDVPLLARAFWRRLSAESQTRAGLGPEAVASLCRHGWPGNVRELQNVVSALVVSAPTRGLVTSRHVAAALGATGAEATATVRLDAAMRGFERRVVAAALARHGGRRTGAARELGLTRQGLTKAIRRLGLHDRGGERAGVA